MIFTYNSHQRPKRWASFSEDRQFKINVPPPPAWVVSVFVGSASDAQIEVAESAANTTRTVRHIRMGGLLPGPCRYQPEINVSRMPGSI
jgi:hypothetical protein